MAKCCSIDGCERPAMARGWCGKHYQRWRATGDPLAPDRRNLVTYVGCSIPGCDGEHEARGWCHRHYGRFLHYGDPEAPDRRTKNRICDVAGCGERHVALGFCAKHYRKFQLYGDPLADHSVQAVLGECVVEGCDRLAIARGACTLHYHRLKKFGDPAAGEGPREAQMVELSCASCGAPFTTYVRGTRPLRKCCSQVCAGRLRAAARRRKRTGRFVDRRGYVRVWRPDHPNATGSGYILEHRLVMAQQLDRPLLPTEVIHHRNGIKDDNRLENLELLTTHQHGRLRRDLTACPHCGGALSFS